MVLTVTFYSGMQITAVKTVLVHTVLTGPLEQGIIIKSFRVGLIVVKGPISSGQSDWIQDVGVECGTQRLLILLMVNWVLPRIAREYKLLHHLVDKRLVIYHPLGRN